MSLFSVCSDIPALALHTLSPRLAGWSRAAHANAGGSPVRWLESVLVVALSLQMADRMESCRERMRQTDLGSLPEAQAWLKEQLAVLKAQLQSYKEAFRATRIEVT